MNYDDLVITLEVDGEVIEGVRKGEISRLELNMKDDELNLEVFQFIVLTDGDNHCLTRILEVNIEETVDEGCKWKVFFNISTVNSNFSFTRNHFNLSN